MIEVKYRSAFSRWHHQASIRSRNIETFYSEDCGGRWLFSPQLVPWSQHPFVVSKGANVINRLLAYHLLDHLEFTDALENEVITPVCYMLARGAGGFELPAPMAADARKIAVDEVYHALMVADLESQVAATFVLGIRPVFRHPFLQCVDVCLAKLPPEMHPLLRFMAACVSETLITCTLTGVPNDGEVVTAVRNTLRNHAEDEARHHAYFSKIVEVVWPQLRPKHRVLLGPFLPSLIRSFVSPNPVAVLSDLQVAGLSQLEARRVVDEATFDGANQCNSRSCEKTLNCFERGGAFEDAATSDACAKAGFGLTIASFESCLR